LVIDGTRPWSGFFIAQIYVKLGVRSIGGSMNIFGIGLPEMALIFILALLVFGPKKLPEIGKTLGKTIRGFQDASKEFEQEFKRAAESIEDAVKDEPMQATLEPPAQLAAAMEDAIPEATLAAPEGVAAVPEQLDPVEPYPVTESSASV
jgi:sec-independent protein translocase protein TatA